MNDTTADIIVEKAKAGYPALYLLSSEDMRSQREVRAAAVELNRNYFIWTPEKGLYQHHKREQSPEGVTRGNAMAKARQNVAATEGPKGIDGTSNHYMVLDVLGLTSGPLKVPPQSIVVLRLFHHWLKDPLVQAKLLDLIPLYKTSQRTLIILSPVQVLPPEVEKEFALVESSYPDKETLGGVLDGIVTGSGFTGDMVPNEELRKHILEAALGLTTSEAESAMALALVRPKRRTGERKWDPQVVLDEKCMALRKSGLLEYIPAVGTDMNSVGGMKALKAWVRKRKRAWGPEAKAFGLPSPKGILMVGPPGSGKSLGAKAISQEWNLPLIRLDMGRMFGGVVGESERNMREAIKIAEAVAPCVLWMDEIEKGLAGAQGGALDSGVGARLLGYFLTWMQEKSSPVFVYATSNDVTGLPPELLRKGRFDEMFSVLLPTDSEREEIFRIHLTKRGRAGVIGNHAKDQTKVDLKHFVQESKGFSGAEIEACIVEALYDAFDENHELNFYDLQKAVDNITPLSVTMAEKLQRLEAWCKSRTRPANGEENQIPVEQLIPQGRLVQA